MRASWWSGPWRRSKTVPRSSWFGPFFVLSFGIAFLVVLGSSWGRFWSSWAPLRVVFGRSGGRFGAFSAFQLIDSTRQLINSSIQLINSSTHGPSALSYPARRTARCAIKSAATRRVGACPDSFRISLSNSSNSKSLARPRAFRRASKSNSKSFK